MQAYGIQETIACMGEWHLMILLLLLRFMRLGLYIRSRIERVYRRYHKIDTGFW